MRGVSLTTASCLAGLVLVAPATAAPLAADSAKVYQSPRGEEVVVVMLKPPSDNKAVIRVTGSSSLLDGLVLPYEHSVEQGQEFFTTSWHGRSFSFVQAQGGPSWRWQLYVPGDLRTPHPLTYSEPLTRALQVGTVLALHESQRKDGSLQRFAAFDRAAEQAELEKELRATVAAAAKACGVAISFRVVWSTIDDETLKKYSINSYCSTPLDALAAMCKASKVASGLLTERVKEVSCGFAATTTLAVTGGVLEWKVDPEAISPEAFATKQLEAVELRAPAAPKAGEQPPWGDAHTLGQAVLLAHTGVCTDGKNHYVVTTPRAPGGGSLYYGDGKQLTRVELAKNLGSGDFFEPRYENPTAPKSFRGYDMRLISSVEFDEEKQTCGIRCGSRRTELKLLPAAAAAKLLTAASYLPPHNQYLPHALTRDDRGNYYYVDKGSTPETAKRFRLFVGPKGRLTLQRMINVVSDSQGEIFSTKSGDLRFIVGPQGRSSAWVKGTQRTELLALEIEDNMNLIWNELGVYAGEKRGTPCDAP